jgi:hypothetical protein
MRVVQAGPGVGMAQAVDMPCVGPAGNRECDPGRGIAEPSSEARRRVFGDSCGTVN